MLFSGTYLNRYAVHYSGMVYNENAKLSPAGRRRRRWIRWSSARANSRRSASPATRRTGRVFPAPILRSPAPNGSTGPASRVIRIVVYGLKGDIHVEGHDFNAAAMPVFGQVTGSAYNWSDEKIAAVLTYVRHEWGNNADAVTLDDVTAVHKAVGERKEMTEPELESVK